MLNELRPKGGHLTHLVPAGQNKALCGYEPSATRRPGLSRQMKMRHGWSTRLVCLGSMKCKHCEAVAKKMANRPTEGVRVLPEVIEEEDDDSEWPVKY